ncbi:hypothetical protein GCM10009804_52100 [Kribbella hippodromi]|uniref:Uncharacterized protein n=1 Tax=Kribbella hippodromi TaxID=434347 RepID=A0ABN2DX64_9ACTN
MSPLRGTGSRRRLIWLRLVLRRLWLPVNRLRRLDRGRWRELLVAALPDEWALMSPRVCWGLAAIWGSGRMGWWPSGQGWAPGAVEVEVEVASLVRLRRGWLGLTECGLLVVLWKRVL